MSRFKEYLWANLAFWGFLLCLSLLAWLSCVDPADDAAIGYVLGFTFRFLILLFGIGFTVVTLFDAALDAVVERSKEKR